MNRLVTVRAYVLVVALFIYMGMGVLIGWHLHG